MRIISGENKGYILNFPCNLSLRPTTDICRESLFNILNNIFYFEKLSVLELFAGTGSVSFEFASRGCKDIICVDNHFKCINWIENECTKLGYDFIEAVRADALIYLKNFAARPFDIIFADPPYDFKNYPEIAEIVFREKLLAEKGWLILEHDRKNSFKNLPFFCEQRIYGQSGISIFKNV